MLSVLGDQLRATVVWLVAVALRPCGVDGGVLSGFATETMLVRLVLLAGEALS